MTEAQSCTAAAWTPNSYLLILWPQFTLRVVNDRNPKLHSSCMRPKRLPVHPLALVHTGGCE